MSDGKTRRYMNEREWQCFEDGVKYERERIIKLLHEKAAVNWIEALEYPYYADELEELIKGEK